MGWTYVWAAGVCVLCEADCVLVARQLLVGLAVSACQYDDFERRILAKEARLALQHTSS